MIHTLKNKTGKSKGMILEVELEKAYDRLEWDFIKQTVRRWTSSSMVNVILNCISNASFRQLWNSECTDSIKQTRGIMQGDPISPYVFVLCLERLARRIQK